MTPFFGTRCRFGDQRKPSGRVVRNTSSTMVLHYRSCILSMTLPSARVVGLETHIPRTGAAALHALALPIISWEEATEIKLN